MDKFIELQNITKKYKSKCILDRVTLAIPTNQVTAVVGKNGSGKSTFLKLVGGLLKPDSGQIIYSNNAERLRIGYVPEVTPSVVPFTPVEYLTHMGLIRGLPKEWIQHRINILLEMFHMVEDRNRRMVYFSKGMKQKVTIMQAMLEETDLLIMDEPLSGLDPKAQRDLEEILISLKCRKISIMLSCHETRLLEKVVDQILVIRHSQVIHKDGHQARDNTTNRLVFELPNTVAIETLLDKVTIEKEKEIGYGLRLIELSVNQEETNQIVRDLLERGASIKLLAPVNKLEKEFLYPF